MKVLTDGETIQIQHDGDCTARMSALEAFSIARLVHQRTHRARENGHTVAVLHLFGLPIEVPLGEALRLCHQVVEAALDITGQPREKLQEVLP